jgi:hypothetical protein
MKIPLKAVTVIYTRTRTFIPTTEMFDDWDVEPSQEGFEEEVIGEFFDTILEDVGGNGNPMPYTHVEQLGDVEIDFDWEDEE